MILINHVFFLIIIYITAVENNQQDLMVSSLSIFPHPRSSKLYNLNVDFRENVNSVISNAEIEIKVLDKRNRTLERKTVVFDDSLVSNINYTGQYFGISYWIKSDDKTEIQIIGWVHSKADENSFQIEQRKRFHINQILLFRKLPYAKQDKIAVTLTSGSGEKGLVLVHSIAKITCKVHSNDKGYRPTFHSHSTLLKQKETYNERKNEVQMTFRAQATDHLSHVWCSTYGVNKSITINVLHAPTGAIISPQVYNIMKAGSKLNCSSKNGYPQPDVSWKLISGPENASLYYELQNDKRLFLLKKAAPTDSRWQLKCESSNKYGQSHSIIDFTVSLNYKELVQDYVVRMEEDRLLWQRSLMENISARNDQIEKTMRIGLLETTQTMHILSVNMTKELDKMKTVEQHILKEMQMKISGYEEMVKNMKKTEENVEKELRKEMTELKEETENKMKENGESMARKLQEIADAIRHTQDEQIMKIVQQQEKLMEQKLRQVLLQMQEVMVDNEYVWRVEKITDKRQQAARGRNESIFSEYFYTHYNGYRMRLRLYPNGYGDGKGTHLTLAFQICKGPFDNFLWWPMNKKVRLAILNQRTVQEYVGYDYSYEMNKEKFAPNYQKPTKEQNLGLGHTQFISWGDLHQNANVLKNDMLIVRCSFVH